MIQLGLWEGMAIQQKQGDPIATAMAIREPESEAEESQWTDWIWSRAERIRGIGIKAVRELRKEERQQAKGN